MPLSGTSSALASKLQDAVKSKLEAATGQQMAAPAFLKALCEAIAETIIPHITANAMVAPGIPVATAGGPTNQVGATTGPGTIT